MGRIFIYRMTLVTLVFLIFSSITLVTSNSNILEHLSQYDDVFYDPIPVHNSHTRVSRSVDSHLYITFNANVYGKTFNMKLKPAKSLFEHDYIEIDNDKKYPTNSYLFYEGNLIDDSNSHVSGSIIDGVFYGTIKTKNGNYHIESSKRYNGIFKSHSIIYHDNDVIFNNTMKKRDTSHNNHVGCASEKVMQWMKKVQKEAYEENYKTQGGSKSEKVTNERKKRATSTPFPNQKNICDFYLRVDPFFYKEIYNKEGGKSKAKTISFIMSYLSKYVTNINSIYSTLEFYNTAKTQYYTGLKFSIYRTRIITDDMCKIGNLSSAEQKICENYLDVQTFLSYTSLDDYSSFCLSFTFTARDFADGTLGLAWVAKASGSIGGLCERRQAVQGVQKSLNCGIVTILNYQARVTDALTTITFAHEVGHNFGAEHDPSSNTQCVPGDSNGGNYIMYGQATTGTKTNNNKFSQCSKDSMSTVVVALAATDKFCFKASNVSVCGNMIVEDGEECDCGFQTDCTESCCYDANQDSSLKCKLKPSAQCSPSQGPCCNSTCRYANSSTICYSQTDCISDVKCTGTSSLCSTSNPIYFINFGSDGKIKECNSGTQICRNGTCTGSICDKYGMTQCYLEGDLSDASVDKKALCHVACQGAATNNSCMDSFKISAFNYSGYILKAGSPCSGTQGYCDIFSKCRLADEGSPLADLEDFLLNPPTLSDIQSWFTKYWWAILLIALGFLLFIGLISLAVFHVTPSSNPKKAKPTNKTTKKTGSKAELEADSKNLRKRTTTDKY